jgi:transposase-like protein
MTKRHKSAIAINLNAINCPRCNLRQPKFRMPRSLKQFFFGGWTCERCHTEMDSFGRPVFRF